MFNLDTNFVFVFAVPRLVYMWLLSGHYRLSRTVFHFATQNVAGSPIGLRPDIRRVGVTLTGCLYNAHQLAHCASTHVVETRLYIHSKIKMENSCGKWTERNFEESACRPMKVISYHGETTIDGSLHRLPRIELKTRDFGKLNLSLRTVIGLSHVH
jgi:hypothetical protein